MVTQLIFPTSLCKRTRRTASKCAIAGDIKPGQAAAKAEPKQDRRAETCFQNRQISFRKVIGAS
jgi:hypothetical protein